MANQYQQGAESITQAEHISPAKTGDNIEAKKIAGYVWNPISMEWERQTSSVDANLQVGGSDVSGANPVQVTGTVTATGAALDIEYALEETAYDLNAAAYSDTTAISTDYLASQVVMNFSTAEAKSITVTSSDGTVVRRYPASGTTTEQDIVLDLFDAAYNGGDNLTVAVAQTAGACSMDLRLTIKQGSIQLAGNPVLDPESFGFQSSLNSTSTASNGDGFTGTFEQNNMPDVGVSLHTDVVGTLYFDFSPDGTTVNSFPVAGFEVDAGIHEFHTAVKLGRYFKPRFVKSSGTPTYFRLYTYYGTFRQGNLPINANISNDADAIVVRSIEPGIDLAFGRISGMSEDNKFGYIENIGNTVVRGNSTTWQDVWFYGGLRTAPTSTFTPYIASTNSGDTSIPVTYIYFDANNVKQTGTTTTDASDGQTPVSLAVTAGEVTRAWVTGSTNPAGTITITTANNFTNGDPNSQDQVLAAIGTLDNQSQICADRVPASTQRRIKRINMYCLTAGGTATSVQAVFQTRDAAGSVWRTRKPIFASSSSPFNEEITGIIMDAGDDFRIRIRDVSDNSTYVSCDVDYEDVEV